VKVRNLLIILALLLAIPTVSFADQVITFEGYPDLTVFTNQFPEVDFNGATVLQLGGTLNPQFPPHSGINVVYNPSGAMSIQFVAPVGYFEGYFTYNLPLVMQAFDVSNTLLATYNSVCSANYIGAGQGCDPNELGIVTANGIDHVLISGGGGNNFTLDDAQFTGSLSSSPEPGTLCMLGSGILGIAAVIRRRLNV
jgi:hypothetical protein